MRARLIDIIYQQNKVYFLSKLKPITLFGELSEMIIEMNGLLNALACLFFPISLFFNHYGLSQSRREDAVMDKKEGKIDSIYDSHGRPHFDDAWEERYKVDNSGRRF
jgi:hypothetical protein